MADEKNPKPAAVSNTPAKTPLFESAEFTKDFTYDGNLPKKFQWRGNVFERDNLTMNQVIKLAKDSRFAHIAPKEKAPEAK